MTDQKRILRLAYDRGYRGCTFATHDDLRTPGYQAAWAEGHKQASLDAVARAAAELGRASMAGDHPGLIRAGETFQAAIAAARAAGCSEEELVIAIDAGGPIGDGE